MPKSLIIKDIVEDTVPLETSLNRVLVLAKDIENKDLEQWVKNELSGYGVDAIVPEYRKQKCPNFRYSGINGSFQINHNPLPPSLMGIDLLEQNAEVIIRNGIRTVQEYSLHDNALSRDVTFMASEIYNRTNGGVQCTSIEQIVPQAVFQEIVAEVKNRMISVLFELEKKYGNLDSLDIDATVSNKKNIYAQNEEYSKMLKKDVINSKKVFIVHGHDNEIKQMVARAVEHASLIPVILHEQADGGRTIIEKLEHFADDAAYAIILYTGCDVGKENHKPDLELKPRARQNVVFEHGMFVGLLGRKRVGALVKNDVEKPGDIDGVLYIDVDDAGAWKMKLAQNMREAGIEFDYEGMLT